MSVATKAAQRRFIGIRKTLRTRVHVFLDEPQCLLKFLRQIRRAEDVIRQPLRRLRAHTREAIQFVNEFFERADLEHVLLHPREIHAAREFFHLSGSGFFRFLQSLIRRRQNKILKHFNVA